MASVYHPWLVAPSLAARVAATEGNAARIWLGIGGVVRGVGIWSMHFIGMLALSLPIQLAYDIPTTLVSLSVAIVTSGFALAATGGQNLTMFRLGGAAVVMGAGISTMHYMG